MEGDGVRDPGPGEGGSEAESASQKPNESSVRMGEEIPVRVGRSPGPDPRQIRAGAALTDETAAEIGGGVYKESIGYALWCLFFLGLGGIHRIYLGKYGTGILWILTWGLLGIGQFVDLFRMRNLVQDANVRDGHLPHPRWAAQLRPAPPASEPDRSPGSLMQTLLQAAARNGGALTVTQGVAATGRSFSEIEAMLRDMVAEGYVDVDNAPGTGVVVYRFPELAEGDR